MSPLAHRSKSKTRKALSAPSRTRSPLGMERLEERALMAFGAEFTIGSEFTFNNQVATASTADGTSVAVWTLRESNGDTDIVGQLYNADGTERGGIINIVTGATADSEPAVAMEANGDFAVSFTRQHNFGFLNLGVDRDIRVRRFNSAGTALDGSIGVTLSDNEVAFESDIAMDSNGDFVVTYTAETTKTRPLVIFGVTTTFTESFTDRDVRARRFDRNGNAVGGTFGVDTSSSLFEQNPSVAMADDGRFVIAYENGDDIHLRQFTADGTLRRTRVIADSTRRESNPDVAVDSSGNAVVVWQDTTNGSDVKSRRVTDGGTLDATLTVRNTSAFENKPSVALSRDGNNYIVAYNREINNGLVAEHVDATRVTRSGSSDVVQGHQDLGLGMDFPSISVDGANRFFVGYIEIFDAQAVGRWGQMGSTDPTDKLAHDFEIDLVFGGGLTATQRAIFQQAADRWEEVILGDLPNATFDGIDVDDVQIDARAVAIDGASGVLGQAAPDTFRIASSLPIHGFMQFDTADIVNLETGGRLFNVILHEMGHVLGVGTLWDNLDLIQGAGTANPIYTGVHGVALFNASRGILGLINPASSIPVEGDGGAGTADSHWDEDAFDAELMTGFVESAGVTMPLSRMTVGSLEDMGYAVNYAAADPFGSGPVLNLTVTLASTGNPFASIREEEPSSLREEDSSLPTDQRVSLALTGSMSTIPAAMTAPRAGHHLSDATMCVRSSTRWLKQSDDAHDALDQLFAQEYGDLG
jgi:hypothetical protein